MKCGIVDANGYLQLQPDDYVGACTAYVMTADEVAFLSTLTLSPADMSQAFAWGFGVVVFFGLGIPYAVKITRDLIRLL